MRKLIVLCILSIFCCSYYLVRFYAKTPIKKIEERIKNTNTLIKEGKTTLAYYDNEYTEFKRRGRLVSKTIGYTYNVDNKTYKGKKSIGEVPLEDAFMITYLPQNPSQHSENPKNDLVNHQNQLAREQNENPISVWIILIISKTVLVVIIKKIKNQINEQRELENLSTQYKTI
jgi:hypothetical protein